MEKFTRRRLLGSSALTMAALAGCGDDSREEADPSATTSEQQTSSNTQSSALRIENVHFCSEQPTGFRQYSEQPGARYDPDETVWLYFEPSSVGTEPAGEGQIHFAFDIEGTIHGPDGTELDTLSRSAERTVPESADLSELFLWVDFYPAVGFDLGTHEIEIEVNDTVAGNTATETLEFTVERGQQQTDPFEIQEIIFTTEQASGFDEYTPQPDAEYGLNDSVWYYYEIYGMNYEQTDEAVLTNVSILETLKGPDGDVMNEADIPISNEYPPDIDEPVVFVADHLSPSEWLPGTYTLTLEGTDGYTGETTTQSGTFTIVE